MIDSAFVKALTSEELDRVVGGANAMETLKAEAQIFQTLSSAVSEVLKNFGGALQTAARGG
jgi:hypothetical protein